MSIFGIIGIVFIISCLITLVVSLMFMVMDMCCYDVFKPGIITCSIIFGACMIGGTFIGIGLNDQDERVFIAKYEASKYTIEQSLKNEELTGLERVQLVSQAATLNGEFAERKAKFNLWHHVHYDNTIYDGVDFINLGE